MLQSGLSGTNLKHAKDHNLRVTLQAIRLQGPVSRAELAAITGLTAQAIAYISKKLIDQNLVMETGRRRGGRGQPATEIAINPDGGFSVGVNIDRDHLTVVLIDLSGEVRGRLHIEQNFMLPDQAFDWIDVAYHSLLKENGLTSQDLAGVGLAIPFKLGYLRLAITPEPYAAWHDYPSKQRLEKIAGLPVYEENDATASAIGESQYGHGIETPSFFYLFFGYGLGGGLVLNGAHVEGVSGHGGEIGHIPLEGITALGKRPVNLQDKVSLATLYAYLEKAGLKVSHPGELADLYETQPAQISAWLDTAADHLLAPLTAVNCVVNPGAILIGGRLPDRMIDALIDALEKRIDPIRADLPDAPPIMRAQCSTDAAALGAAIVPFTRILFPAHDVLLKKAG
jgi:predicted NBD/HSP70 family sugar kinase